MEAKISGVPKKFGGLVLTYCQPSSAIVRLSKPAAPSLVNHLAIDTHAGSNRRPELLNLFSSN